MRFTLLTAIAAAAIAMSCSISDEDRCPGGYTFNPDKLACEADEKEDTDTLTDSAGDAGEDPDGGGDGPPSGMGETCGSNDDCAEYEADTCAVNPMTQIGYCTVLNCTPGECPTAYKCCTCVSEEKQRDICLSAQQGDLAVQVGSCSTCS